VRHEGECERRLDDPVQPLLPGKIDEGRAFAKTAFTTRAGEFATSRRALRQNGEVVTVTSTPMGDFSGVYLEGDDPAAGNRIFAASQSAFDHWFKDECKKIFPPQIDFDKPVPPVVEFFDSMAMAAT
jgi:hypothetical protein